MFKYMFKAVVLSESHFASKGKNYFFLSGSRKKLGKKNKS